MKKLLLGLGSIAAVAVPVVAVVSCGKNRTHSGTSIKLKNNTSILNKEELML